MACDLPEKFKRAIAIVLQDHVEDLYQDVLAIREITKDWILDSEAFYLPSRTAVKVQLENYEALSIHPVRLGNYIRELRECEENIPDGVTIPSSTGITFPSVNPIMF